jgi:hypothetical protein
MIHVPRVRFLLLIALLTFVVVVSRSLGCPFCQPGKTLSGETKAASLVFCGKLINSNEKNNTTDIHVERVFKDNPIRGTRKQLTLSRYVSLERTRTDDRFLVFGNVLKGTIDPVRGVSLQAGSKLPDYLQKAVEVQDKPLKQRLRFFFDYLDNDDPDISTDAYREFANTPYTKDFKELLRELPVERVIKWLRDPRIKPERIGLYASMVGHAGKEKDTAVLRELLENPERRASGGVDGLLAGYAMGNPKEGWPYLLAALKNRKEEFAFRYAALRAVRFLHDYRPDVVAKKELLDGVCELLKQEDIADLAIEDLRKWAAWDRADKVLGVVQTDAYKQSIIKRAILLYCLQCKGNDQAKALVEAQRRADPEAVRELEEKLKREQSGR